MQNIEGDDKTIEVLLSGAAFGIDYYQREYRWERKQLQELVDDLHGQFLQTWNPNKPDTPLEEQSRYFLGSIVISKAGVVKYIVDGQQRITTFMLLLIYLNHLQSDMDDKVKKIESLVFADDSGGNKFKLDIPERNDCMSTLPNATPLGFEELSGMALNQMRLPGRDKTLLSVVTAPTPVQKQAFELLGVKPDQNVPIRLPG